MITSTLQFIKGCLWSLLFVSSLAFGGIHPGSHELCLQELDSIPVEFFRSDNVSLKSKESEAHLVEIQGNKAFVNHRLIDDDMIAELQSLSVIKDPIVGLIMLMYQLAESRDLPNVSFLFVKDCSFLDPTVLEQLQVPILVGTNSQSYVNKNLITFLSPCPIANQYLTENRNRRRWSLAQATMDTLAVEGTVPWENKLPKVFWRGLLSDLRGGKATLEDRKCLCHFFSPPLTLTPREYLCVLSKFYPAFIDAGITGFFPGAKILKSNDFMPFASIRDHIRYRYQIVLDGIHCTTPGYAWRLLSDCCVLKVDSPLYNFFYVNLRPWVHYVPVAKDLHDLIDIIAFLEKNQELSQEIARNGTEFALNYLKPEDYLDFCVMVLSLYAEKQKQAGQTYGGTA